VRQQRAQLRRAFALARLSVRSGSHRVQRTAGREVDLRPCQALACGWYRGDSDVMFDGTDAELDTRFHGSPARARRLMSAPGGDKPSKHNSRHRGALYATVPPHGHIAKFINVGGATQQRHPHR